jgi:hypothetical protein
VAFQGVNGSGDEQMIAGSRDAVIPLANAEFLHAALPDSQLDIVDSGHFVWEDRADEYAALVNRWWRGGYARVGSRSGRCSGRR